MSADAASLPCPICSHTGVFQSVQSLRDRLIAVSTNKITCPVCQEEVVGLDKLTIHLFSHVNLVSKNEHSENNDSGIQIPDRCSKPLIHVNLESKNESSEDNVSDIQISDRSSKLLSKVHQKKSKPCSAKNSGTTLPNAPVKFVKIFPKLPVITLNPVPLVDFRSPPFEECVQSCSSIYTPTAEASPVTQIDTISRCNICGLQFVDANILRMHKCLIHNTDENSNINSTRYHCHLCPKHFKMRGSLMVHLRVAHYGFHAGDCRIETKTGDNPEPSNPVTEDKPATIERTDNKQWQCDVCRKCFTTKYFLKKHKRLHTGETPYTCAQCNKTFTFQQSYHKHLLYHNDEKPHICNYCGRAFKELSTLHNHERIHTGEKPFSCETCGKCFRQRVSYLVHRRIHTGVMPYKCTACDKSFRYKVSQRTHKCQAQPPGTVVRQSCDLVEKLKKKHKDSNALKQKPYEHGSSKLMKDTEESIATPFTEVSEANAKLAVIGAKLSLEDMESEDFSLIEETFKESHKNCEEYSGTSSQVIRTNVHNAEFTQSDLNELIETIPAIEKNVPSPSDILEKLCLSKDEDYIDELPDLF